MPKVFALAIFLLAVFNIPQAICQEAEEILTSVQRLESQMQRIRIQDQKILVSEEKVLEALDDLQIWIRRRAHN